MYLSTYLPIYLPTYLPIYLSTYLPIYLSTYLPIYLSIYLFITLSIYLSLYHSIILSFYHSIIHSIILFIYIYVHGYMGILYMHPQNPAISWVVKDQETDRICPGERCLVAFWRR